MALRVLPSHSFNTCSTIGWLILLSSAFNTNRTDSKVLFFFLTILLIYTAVLVLREHEAEEKQNS